MLGRGGLERVDGSYDWQNVAYHGMDHKARRTRTYVLQKLWRDHISDKNGRRYNGQGGRMERRKVGGIEIRGVYVHLLQ